MRHEGSPDALLAFPSELAEARPAEVHVSGRLIMLLLVVTTQAFAAPPPADDPAALLAKAKEARKEKAYPTAITLLERCLSLAPDDPDCLLALASTYAARGSQENSEKDNKQARQFYERFLRAARPDDRRIRTVREILGYDPDAPIVVLQQPPRQKPAAKPMAGERVTIAVGGTHRISVPSFERVDIAQPSIATVELESPGVLLVTALKAGNTTLTWSTQDHQTWAIPVTVKAK